MALGSSDEEQLDQLACKLEAAGMPVHRVVESHGKYAGQLMCLGIEPGPKSQRRRLLSSLPLLRGSGFKEWYWSDRELQSRIIDELKQKIRKLDRDLSEIRLPRLQRLERDKHPWWSRLQRWCSKGAA